MNEYIFPDDIYTNPGKFVSIFERFERLCFVGHTHVPGVFLEGPDFYSPDELDYKFELTDEKAIINVGSVGQPRDRDPRSSFVVVNETAVELSRASRKYALPLPMTPKTWSMWRARVSATCAETVGMRELLQDGTVRGRMCLARSRCVPIFRAPTGSFPPDDFEYRTPRKA